MKIKHLLSYSAFLIALVLGSCKEDETPELAPAPARVILYDSAQNQEVMAEIVSAHQERNVNFISCWWVGSDTFQNGCSVPNDISTCAIGYNLIIFRVEGIKGGHPVTINVNSKSGLTNTIKLVVQPGSCVLLDVFKAK